MPKFRLKNGNLIGSGNPYCFLPAGTILDLEEVEETKEWEPAPGEKIWWFTDNGKISSNIHSTTDINDSYTKFGNCFRTREEAEAARDAIKELLKGMKK